MTLLCYVVIDSDCRRILSLLIIKSCSIASHYFIQQVFVDNIDFVKELEW